MESYPAVVQLRGFMAKYPQLKVIAGIDAYHIFLSGEPHSKAVRSSSSGNGTMFFEVLNAAAQFSNESEEVQLYRKSKLVPGPEILPYRRFFGIFEPIIKEVQGTVEGVGTQKERTSMSSSSARMAPVICYESIFGEFFTGYIHKGAQAAVIMTNDGWWDNSPGHRQHLWLGTLRAVETRRSIARAANTGISAFINQRGDILQSTRYNEAGAIKGTVRLNDRVTFYVRWGDLIARIAVFTTLLLLLNTISKSIQERVGK
jgi:apolipoprotein N-acyltransferase